MGFLSKKKNEKPKEEEDEDDTWDDEGEEATEAPMVSVPIKNTQQLSKVKELPPKSSPRKEHKAIIVEQPSAQLLVWADTNEIIAPDMTQAIANIVTTQDRIESKIDSIIARIREVKD